MRFLRVGAPGAEIPVAMVPGDDRVRDLRSLTEDIDGAFLERWGTERAVIESDRLPIVDLDGVRFGPPIARPHAIYAIGLNYRSHAVETNLALPDEPLVFTKSPNSISGPNDDVTLPAGSRKGDWEVELGVVIGRSVHRLNSVADASEAIAGYAAVNDLSERSLQFDRGGQWLKGKSFPTANPIGPYLVTPDELGSPGDLSMKLSVNGEMRQNGTTADLVFGVDYLIWYLSQFVRLEPGDLIDTGTPDGVGLGMSPPQYLADGDTIDLSIEGLGAHHYRVSIPIGDSP